MTSEWDILDWFIMQRKTGSNIYYTIKQVHKENNPNCHIHTTRRKLISLTNKGFLERELSGTFREWYMKFRVKDKYVNTSIEKSI